MNKSVSINATTFAKVMQKLQIAGRSQYRLLGLCIFLSVQLVASFSLMYFSKTVQSLLPEGGDTRSLSLLMLSVTILGCTIFTLYGASLFFRYKSRELGVLLALGETKHGMSKYFGQELIRIIISHSLLGLMAAFPLSYVVWRIFAAIALPKNPMPYHLQFVGILPGITFALLLICCVLLSGRHFIKKADIITILHASSKTENVHIIPSWTGRCGIVMIILGLFLAMGVPSFVARVYHYLLPGIWNLTYFISAIGLYLFLLSAVGHQEKGRHPKRYYKNIISTNLMRFTARQTTRNMCVITMLLFVLLLAAFWGAQYYQSAYSGCDNAPYDYSLHYPNDVTQVTLDEITTLAQDYDVQMYDMHEITALNLVVTFSSKDLSENREYFDITREKNALFLSASDYAALSGENLILSPGEYATIVPKEYQRTIWYGPDCLLSIATTSSKCCPKFITTTELDNLTAFSDPFTFVISDEDYAAYLAEALQESTETIILFRVENPEQQLEFAKALEETFVNHSSTSMHRCGLYDSHEEQLAHAKGLNYSYSGEIPLDINDPYLLSDWKYAPYFKILYKTEAMQLVAIFVLLSIYIAIISLMAIGVMTYVRGVTIALENQSLFRNLSYLGANRAYIQRVVLEQLKKIVAYPGFAGAILSLAFTILMVIFNDMHIQSYEYTLLLIMCCLILLVGLYLGILFRITYRKMLSMINIY